MSTLETILARAMSDPRFADLLFADTETALAEYDIAPNELAKLRSISQTEFEALAVDERKSMVMKHLGNVKYND